MSNNIAGKRYAGKPNADSTTLLAKSADAPIAWLSEKIQDLPADVSARHFLRHVHSVASALPQSKHAINLCNNRYLFLVALCAVVVRSQTNLLPSNKNTETQKRLAERYSETYIIHDGELATSDGVAAININDIAWCVAADEYTVPTVSLDHLAVISFTSGSTGDPKPNLKTWRTLRESTFINGRYMLPNEHDVFYHLATVPGQHMWGLETSVLMPLFSNACLVDARPLYPHDIVDLLKRIPNPKCLISTPLHLRALAGVEGSVAEHSMPKLDNVLVATAPLAQALAQQIEGKFDTQLREVYGCSEVGSMAVRHTAQTDVWTAFSGINFVTNNSGEVSVSADHLPAPVTLEDRLERVDEYSFRLQGRVTDQIKVAGKRGSLLEVNTLLMKYRGLVDGVVFFPPQDKAVPRLVAIIVLEKGHAVDKSDKDSVRAHFRRYLDSAFVPRPIFFVDSLPREDNGKLLKTKLMDFYTTLISKR